jgi:hypothetical protein
MSPAVLPLRATPAGHHALAHHRTFVSIASLHYSSHSSSFGLFHLDCVVLSSEVSPAYFFCQFKPDALSHIALWDVSASYFQQ